MSVTVEIIRTVSPTDRKYVNVCLSVTRSDRTFRLNVDPRDVEMLIADLQRVGPEALTDQAIILADVKMRREAEQADRPAPSPYTPRPAREEPKVQRPGKTERDRQNTIQNKGDRHPTNVGNPNVGGPKAVKK